MTFNVDLDKTILTSFDTYASKFYTRDSTQISGVLFLDFTKAFDLVHHEFFAKIRNISKKYTYCSTNKIISNKPTAKCTQ